MRENGPLSDGDVRRITGISPHQQVNQICRRLEATGVLRRERGATGPILNILAWDTSGPAERPPKAAPPSGRPASERPPAAPSHPAAPPYPTVVTPSAGPLTALPPGAAPTWPHHLSANEPSHPTRPGDALLVIPCSGRKASGGTPRLGGRSVAELLPAKLARPLIDARTQVHQKARVDESCLLPAWQRYTGRLYRSAGDAFSSAVTVGWPIVILSGGYGLVLVGEPIGDYKRMFTPDDWPRDLVEDCLLAVAAQLGRTRILGFCARTTNYAKVLRRAATRDHSISIDLVTPEMHGRGGAQVLVPRASGEALSALVRGTFCSPWHSSDGVEATVERLR